MSFGTCKFDGETILALGRIHACETDVGAGLIEFDSPAEERIDRFQKFFRFVCKDLIGKVES